MKTTPEITGIARLRADENTQCFVQRNTSSRYNAANDAVMEKPPARAARSMARRPSALQDTRQIAMLLHSMFRDVASPLQVRLWDGSLLRLGRKSSQAAQEPQYELHCKHPRAFRAMALSSDPLSVAEAYFRDDIDVSGDFFCCHPSQGTPG
jgi:hypothetical protein